MKLVIAVVQDRDVARLLDDLMDHHYGVTKLASTGGFLKSGNTTLLVGVKDENVEDVKMLIRKNCKAREKIVTPVTPVAGTTDSYMSYPVKVVEGGANVFVVDVNEYVKF